MRIPLAMRSRNRFAHRESLRIGYEVRGRLRRRPWLVLIQGLGFDRSGWDPVLRGLQRRFRLLLLDNRGCGRSSVSRRPFSVRDLADDVVAVMQAAGVRRAHIAGASLGGMVAQEVAIEHPERVDRLVLACTTPGWPIAYPMPASSVRRMAVSQGLPREVAVRRTVETAVAAGRDPALVQRLVRHQLARPVGRTAWLALAAAGSRYRGGVRQRGIRAPTLVIHGSLDRVVDPRNSRLLHDRIPDAELVSLPGLGHLFFWEDPDAFVAHVTRFLLAPRSRGRRLRWGGRDTSARHAGWLAWRRIPWRRTKSGTPAVAPTRRAHPAGAVDGRSVAAPAGRVHPGSDTSTVPIMNMGRRPRIP